MAKKVETWDDNWKLSEHYSHFSRKNSEFGYWISGLVATKYGYVITYQQNDHTDIRFIWDERVYTRSWQTEYSAQWVVTLAKRFVREITGYKKVG